MTPKQLAAKFMRLKANLEVMGEIAVVEGAELIKHSAQHEWIGQEHESWPPLTEGTIEKKERAGVPDLPNPLVFTGELRDSIEVRPDGLKAFVGTDHPLAKYHEFGTGTVPPRPFMSSAAMSKSPEVEMILQRAINKAFRKTFR